MRMPWRLENGVYVVKHRDLPLYRVDLGPGGAMTTPNCRRALRTASTAPDLLR